MTMLNEDQALEVQTFDFARDVLIAAPIEITFEAVLAELGPEGSMPDGKPFPFVFEPWPGGRWYRDLGSNTGHLWGHVQVIKPPRLLEIFGPCFLSYPATNHIQYRLAPEGDGTRLRIANRAFGYMPRRFMEGADQGWEHGLRRIAEIAARLKAKR
ncbi:MAG: SRPBCC domain-containing protein [Tepidisphaeraceae bacterium]